MRDYEQWHRGYDDPKTGLGWRLSQIRGHIAEFLDSHDGPVDMVSVCAGDGRDIIGALSGRTDLGRVHAVLVEIHPRIAGAASDAAARAGGLTDRITVITADAGASNTYRA